MSVTTMVLQQFGFAGMIFVIWYFGLRRDQERDRARVERDEKKDAQIAQILTQYREDVSEIKRLYKNNVELVRRYEQTSGDLKEVIIMSTQTMTELCTSIKTNQYCPMVRQRQGEE